MAQGYYIWSKTPAANATADASIGWSEGQAPSSINDSARAMMARTAEYRDDIAGAIVTTGSSTAYAVTTNQVFDSLPHMNGQMIAFTPHVTNAAGPVTLAVDGVGAKALRASPNVELPDGALILGTPYVALYNNSDAAWYLRGGLSNPYSIPLGGFLAYAGSTAPNSSFALPYGQAISRTTYATLFSLVGSTYGAGDGSTTFNIPDCRGRFIAGKDNMGGSAASRITTVASGVDGSTIGSTGGAQNQNIAQNQLPNVSPTFTGTSATVTVSSTISNIVTGSIIGTQQSGGSGQGTATGNFTTAIVSSNGPHTPSGTVSSLNGGVSQAGLIMLPPTIVATYLLRVI